MRYFPKFYLGPYYIFFDWKIWSLWRRHMCFYPPVEMCEEHLDEFIVLGPMRIRRIYHFKMTSHGSSGLVYQWDSK